MVSHEARSLVTLLPMVDFGVPIYPSLKQEKIQARDQDLAHVKGAALKRLILIQSVQMSMLDPPLSFVKLCRCNIRRDIAKPQAVTQVLDLIPGSVAFHADE